MRCRGLVAHGSRRKPTAAKQIKPERREKENPTSNQPIMKRSERAFLKARGHALWAVFCLVACNACGVWAVMAGLSDHWGEFPLWIAAMAALFGCIEEARETSRLLRIARQEEAYEWERSVRPRL